MELLNKENRVFKTTFLTEFICEKLGIDTYDAYNFIKDYNKFYYIDLASELLQEFRDGFPSDYDFNSISVDNLIKIGSIVEEQRDKRDNELIEKILEDMFEEFQSSSTKNFFEGKMIVLKVKGDASATSKRCNCVLCEIISYNKDFVYVKNSVDNCIYCIGTNELY